MTKKFYLLYTLDLLDSYSLSTLEDGLRIDETVDEMVGDFNV